MTENQKRTRKTKRSWWSGAAAVCTALVVAAVALCVVSLPSANVAGKVGLGVFAFVQDTQQSEEAVVDVSQSANAASGNQEGNIQTSQGVSSSNSTTETSSDSGAVDETKKFEDDCVLIRLSSQSTVDELNASLAKASSISSATITQKDIESGLVKLTLANGADVKSALAELSQLEGVEKAQPNFIYRVADESAQEPQAANTQQEETHEFLAQATAINDPRAPEQWHLEDIGAYEAWDVQKGETANPQVTVAVIDSGCKIDHEDLASNLIVNDGEVVAYDASLAESGVDDISSDGHGTHVCGIISAATNNETGVSGVTYNAKVLPIQGFYYKGRSMLSNSYTIHEAYQYIMQHKDEYNIKVVNMSLGGEVNELDESDEAICADIEEAFQAGIITVTAACNRSGSSIPPFKCLPGDYVEHGLCVIALDKDKTRMASSNYNMSEEQRTKDISAPGSSILSVAKTSTSDYKTLSGTSMATPIVSGVAALVYSAYPGITAQQVLDIIHETATDLGEEGFDAETGYGEINASAAVSKAHELKVEADAAAAEEARKQAEQAKAEAEEAKAAAEAAQKAAEIAAKAAENAAKAAESSMQEAMSAAQKALEEAMRASYDSTAAEKAAESVQDALTAVQEAAKQAQDAAVQAAEAANNKELVKEYAQQVADLAKTAQEAAALSGDSAKQAADDVARIAEEIANNDLALALAQVQVEKIAKEAEGYMKAAEEAAQAAKDILEQITSKDDSTVTEKSTQTITVSTVEKNVSAAKLAKKNRTVKCVTKVKGAKSTVVYKRVNGAKALSIDKKTGKVTIKKGTAAGTYRVKVKIFAKATDTYKKSNVVTKKLKVIVK